VGSDEGNPVGAWDGERLGKGVGLSTAYVGAPLGTTLGTFDGDELGDGVGTNLM